MPRKTRRQTLAPNQPNHLVCRGNNRRKLFSYPYERQAYLRLLARAIESYACSLHALCLMQNHVHLLLTPPSVDAASMCIKRVNQRYAQLRNERRGGSGKLFEQSFSSQPIEDEQHLAACTLYINANPFRANLQNCDRFLWSTQALHIGAASHAKIPPAMITLDAWYLSLGRVPTERQAEYRRCFENYVGRSGMHASDPGALVAVGGAPRRPDGSGAE